MRLLSYTASAALLALIAVLSAGLLYAWASGVDQEPRGRGQPSLPALKIDAAYIGRGYVIVYARGLHGHVEVDGVYLYSRDGRLLGRAPVEPPVELEPGKSAVIVVPLVGTGVDPSRVSTIGVSTAAGFTAPAAPPRGASPAVAASASTASTVFGLLAGRCCSCRVGDLDLAVNRVHWVYIDIVTGRYRFRYIDGSTVRDASGIARVFRVEDTLNLSAMTWEERYRLGPVVVFLNPTRAREPYTVTIVDIRGTPHRYTLTPLPGDVAVDALLLWEDLWWPGTTASLDNYIDHVVRATIFTNNTVRIEVLHVSGCYLHMLIYRPGGPPGFDTLPSLIQEYLGNNHTLPEGSGIVYVKSHGAWAPPIDTDRIWDPVNAEWITTWPIVIRLT